MPLSVHHLRVSPAHVAKDKKHRYLLARTFASWA
jgi:hypothetical protein